MDKKIPFFPVMILVLTLTLSILHISGYISEAYAAKRVALIIGNGNYNSRSTAKGYLRVC